eukprot:jgi/Tetstr1/429233/TSEL_001896.t1
MSPSRSPSLSRSLKRSPLSRSRSRSRSRNRSPLSPSQNRSLKQSPCTDEEVFGTEEERRLRATEKRKQALDITGTPGPQRKTKLMTVASFSDFFDDIDESQESVDGGCIDFTLRSWRIHWFKDTSAEICLEPYRLTLYKEIKIDVVFERLLLHAIQPPLSSEPRFQSYYAWTLVERNVLAQALRGFADGRITIDDLANIDKDFENALPYVDTFAAPRALKGFSNTGTVDWISYGHLIVEIADPKVKTSHGGDINMLYADKVNLVTDKDTGLPHIFSFPSDKFVAPPLEFEFRSPKLQVPFPVLHKNGVFSGEYEPLALTMANFKDLVAAFEGGEKPRLADASSYKPEIDAIIKFLGSQCALQANIDGSERREAKLMVKRNYPEIYETNKGIRFTSDKMYIGLSPEVCQYMSMKLNEAGHTVVVGDTSMHKLLSDSADIPVGQMYLVVGLLIQGEHNVTPSPRELVDDMQHAGDKAPVAVTHTNAEWLAMIETWRFRDLLRRASIKVMNAIDTAKGREAISN